MTSNGPRHPISRRDVLKAGPAALLGLGLAAGTLARHAAADLRAGLLPQEPLDIGDDPQFLFDLHTVDSTWGLHEKQDPARRVGHTKQLFIDDLVIGSVTDLSRKVHEPSRHAGNPLITGDEPWERWLVGVNGRPVIYDDESREFKMWYGTYLPDATAPTGIRYRVCYAVSKDGIRWERPELGQVEWAGSRGTNILKGGENWIRRPNVLKDLGDPDPARRYKMTYADVFNGRTAITKAYSSDGIHWRSNGDGAPWFRTEHGANLLGWDPRVARYVIFTKMPGSQDSMGRSTSADFVTWSEPETVLAPGSTEGDANFKGLTAFFYEDLYLGFLYNFKRISSTRILVAEAELAMSRDGRRWQRVTPGESCFRLGPAGSWESDGVFPVAPVVHADRVWVYYNAWNVAYGANDEKRVAEGWVENGVRKQYAIGLATLRLDGFVSLDAGPKAGSLTTKPLEIPGGSLQVNADVRGELRAELLDEADRPLPGYAAADCRPIRSDDLRHVIRWKRGAKLEELRGKVVKLRFTLRDGALYAFGFAKPGR